MVGEIVNVKIEEVNSVRKKLSFEIPWEDVKKGLDAAYRDVAKKARIRGFRQGKIPRQILERHYKDHVEEETITKLINQVYWEAVKEHDLNVVTQPQIDQQGIAPDNNFSFTATVEVEPLLEPKGYLDLELEQDELAVTEQDIDNRLKEVQQMFATMQDIEDDRGLMAGEFATIDFQGMLEGEALKELEAENYFLEVGSGILVPGFEDQLIGMRKGETRQIEVLFPDDYQAAHLAGKNVSFSVELKGLKEKKLPEINEEFVKNFEKYDSLESLKSDIFKSLESEHKARIEADVRKMIVDKLRENKENEFDVPPSFVERQIFQMMADTQRRLLSRGMDKKTATEMTVKMHDAFKDEARKIVLTTLIIKNIARLENISVTEDEKAARIGMIAEGRGMTVEALRESLNKDDMLEHIEYELLNQKVFDFIESKARITTVRKDTPDAREDKP
ncbi:MAG: trigger factor [Syntrophus sp. (in: bacteria)]|nr:trigger factor [Syntrophus sp. (in: bacteria)]